MAKTKAIQVERATNIISIANDQKRETPAKSWATYTRMYKQHPIVRSVIDKIARTAVASGFQFIPRDRAQALNEAAAAKVAEIMQRSNSVALLRETYRDLLIYGDAYWYLTPARNGVPFQMIRVSPSQVNIVINNLTREVTSYIVRDAKNGTETQYAPDEFVHFRFADPDNDLYGLSPLESLISTVAQDLFAQTYNEAFFANSAQTGIVFNMRNASKEEVERNREFLKKEYTSAANAHKPLLLEGDVDVSKSVSSPAEMQFIEGRKQLTMEILAVFDLPYTKLGGTSESANRSQSAENDKTFRSETIKPLQSVIEEVINEQLLYVIFNIKDTLFQHAEVDYRDESAQMDMYIKGLSHGIYTINYVRNKLGLPPIEGGDVASLSTPLGLMPVQEVESAAQAILAAKTGAPANPQV
ncbi:COG4695 Phage-related protein [uncultured Caudovirales phage]|uniref:COG4695 Phage-related protein n=1 Tax=uncultured Caudovirales phage TaxID=2100421 RepID=A0A6J7WTK8_9CAUD|nr:COG4695 Phage-related protein [uncultured Caudovirales phage]